MQFNKDLLGCSLGLELNFNTRTPFWWQTIISQLTTNQNKVFKSRCDNTESSD